MSIDFIIRLVGMVVFTVGGVFWGISIGTAAQGSTSAIKMNVESYAFTLGLVGALIGLVLTPYITTRPFRALLALIKKVSTQSLISSMIGLLIGLLFAAMLAFPLGLLPKPFSSILPFIGVLLFGYLGIAVFNMRQGDIFSMFASLRGDRGSSHWGESRQILLDTSVIIDGRIADIAKTGFLPGTLIIPRFVLNELQYIADSADNLRRQRGRRGMEVLSALQKDTNIMPVKIQDLEADGVREVDDKLVVLARQMHCPILTNDYNLNRIAELQGVTILNVNELANAVKSVMLPGENIGLRVIQEGKESGQGVGYMDDGTMVVVENGRDLIGKEISVTVTKILQTAAGRMIFARPDEMPENSR